MGEDALSQLDWMLGRWTIAGELHGLPVRGEAAVERAVEGSALHARERVVHRDGALDYEDMAIYLWDDSAPGLYVLHIAAPGVITRYAVIPLDGRPGVHWMPADLSARVVLAPEGDGWRAEVWMGTDDTPVSSLRYSPAASSETSELAASSSSMSTNQPAS